MTDTYDYDAFGNAVNSTGSTPNVYLYRGEQYDPDLSLYYLRARYFNALTARFTSTDPTKGDATDPATLHKYLYAGADPIDRVDPIGWADSGDSVGSTAGLLTFDIVAGGYLAFTPGPLPFALFVHDTGVKRPNVEAPGRCCWRVMQRPLSGMKWTYPTVYHVYFYNVCTGQSIGLGPKGGKDPHGPNTPVPGEWETREQSGVQMGPPVQDYMCGCLDKKAAHPGPPPKYCWGAGTLPTSTSVCMNCNAWVTSVLRDCYNQAYYGGGK